MPEKSGEKSGANVDEAPAPLGLRKWRATPDGLEGLERYQLRAMKAAELAMYRAGEEGDRAGVLKAANQLTKCVGSYRKLLAEQRAQEREVTQAELFELMDELANGLNRIFRRHDVEPAAIRDVLDWIKAQTPGMAAGHSGDGAPTAAPPGPA